jgi:hypothetical protein
VASASCLAILVSAAGNLASLGSLEPASSRPTFKIKRRHRQSRHGEWVAGLNLRLPLPVWSSLVVKQRALCGQSVGSQKSEKAALCGISAVWSLAAHGIGCCEPPGALDSIVIGSFSRIAHYSGRPMERDLSLQTRTHDPSAFCLFF